MMMIREISKTCKRVFFGKLAYLKKKWETSTNRKGFWKKTQFDKNYNYWVQYFNFKREERERKKKPLKHTKAPITLSLVPLE